MTTHSSILAWRIPWTEEPGRLRSMGSRRARHAEGTEHTHIVMFRNITDIIISLAQQPLKTSYHTQNEIQISYHYHQAYVILLLPASPCGILLLTPFFFFLYRN